MARQARQESGTGYYHVMSRGINREFLFSLDSNKQVFMQLVAEQQAANMFELAAWCIMGNHVHLLLKADREQISRAVKVINLKYAAHYNRCQKRIGPVFGDRFRSERVEDDTYLLGLIRYLHRNPVQAELVSDVAAYPWSSYGEYLAVPRFISPQQKDFVLSLFSNDRKDFVAFHSQVDDNDYMETKEDTEKNKRTRAISLIEYFCERHGVLHARQLKGHDELFTELCIELVTGAGLSLRQDAEYLETTHHKVYAALKEE